MNRGSSRTRWIVAGAAVLAIAALLVWVVRAVSARGELAKSVQAFTQAKTMHASAELTVQFPPLSSGRERPFTELYVRVEGDAERAARTNAPQLANAPQLGGTLHMESRGRGNVFFADGDVRLLSDATLFRLETLPVLLNPSGSLIKKWTIVSAPVLQTNNASAIQNALSGVFQRLSYTGRESVDGASALHFSGHLNAEDEEKAAAALAQNASGNRALNIVARLLRGSDIKSLDVWVAPRGHEIQRVQIVFVRPGSSREFATLKLSFTDYGKKVSIDRPRVQTSVNPAVFAHLFGTGEIHAQ